MAPAAASLEEAWQWPHYGQKSNLLSADGPFMDFVEHSVELLNCDHGVHDQAALRAARGLLTNRAKPDMPQKDYATLHDNFLESLLQEQKDNPIPRSESSSPPPLMESSSDSVSTFTSHDDSSIATSTTEQPPSKKRRSMRMHRRPVSSPARRRMLDMPPMDDDDSYAPKRVNLLELSTHHPSPDTYMHAECRMQKDKGKGELPGTDICASGRDECLEKLRQKMELLAQVALGSHAKPPPPGKKPKGGADMKRRKARVTQTTSEYVETRSVIQLRMGFLAMQYGVLLRWDRIKHTIIFVVLRKMCSESFYNKTLNSSSSSKSSSNGTSKATSPVFYSTDYVIKTVVNGNHAILQRSDGCEVALLDPPYFVQRPEKFVPSIFQVKVLSVDGLSAKTAWLIKVKFENVSRCVRLGWNHEASTFQPRHSDKSELQWEVPQSKVDLQLEIMLFEQKRPHTRRKRMHTTLPVPLTFLEATPSTSMCRSRTVMIPVDDSSSITLSIQHQSDYVHWLQKEVEARKREEVHGFMWTAPFYRQPKEDAPPSVVVGTPYTNPFALCGAW